MLWFNIWRRAYSFGLVALIAFFVSACSGNPDAPSLTGEVTGEPAEYIIGPGDSLRFFVWGNPELSETVPVRPDGRISVPLIEDMPAGGKTPSQLARDVEEVLAQFIQNPIVTVIVLNFVGPFDQSVRVVGEAAQPQAIPYRANMTVLDAMIAVGGLTEFAAGNDTVVVREEGGERLNYRVRLDDLLKDGDVTANVELIPGDILIIPQSFF